MNKRKWWLATVVGALTVMIGASIAVAAEFEDAGRYTLSLPGIGDFIFDVNPSLTVTEVTPYPTGYTIDDDEADKVAWKNAASLEVEAKLDKVEGAYDWAGGPAILHLDGEWIEISVPASGNFEVTTSSGLWAFGDGSDWYVANKEDPADFSDPDAKFFKIEADEDGVEIKPGGGPDEGFLNDLDDDEEVEELEIETEEAEDKDDD